jgi:hypothetical protein
LYCTRIIVDEKIYAFKDEYRSGEHSASGDGKSLDKSGPEA